MSPAETPLLMLFDGHSMAYRAFHALPEEMTTRSGQVTNMLVGFLGSFFKLYQEKNPDKVVICFDLPKPTFRHKKYKEYKANRPPSPEIFRQQMKILHEILEAMGVPILEMEGYEADDLLASLASLGEKQKHRVIVVTGDRDCFQLVRDPLVGVFYTPTKGEPVLMDEAAVREKMGVLPKSYLQYAALKGDKSDNLPGVPKVGEKTAVFLIERFLDIEGVYKALDSTEEIKPAVKKSLSENKAVAELNLELMKLDEGVKVGVKLSDLSLKELSEDKVRQLFSQLELTKFDQFLKDIWNFEFEVTEQYESINDFVVFTETKTVKDIVLYLKSIEAGTAVSVAGNWNGKFQGFALGTQSSAKCQVIWIAADQLKESQVTDALKPLFMQKNSKNAVEVIAHNSKSLIYELLDYGLDLSNLKFDSAIAAFLNPKDNRTELKDLVARYALLEIGEESDTEGQLQLEEPDPKGMAVVEAAGILKIHKKMRDELKKINAAAIYETMEIPLVGVLAYMEKVGIGVDREELQALTARLEKASKKNREAVISAAGKEFNVNSTKELSKILFEDLGLEPTKRTKQGFSTDASTLEKLKGEHEIVEHILEYRGVEKLRSTYGIGLLKEIKDDGRIHASFSQIVARTGRLSSDAPNLHNIPIRTELGREFRKVFLADKGYELLVADYNQIELRCVAHLCDDPNLKQAFQDGVDVHSSVAERVFNVKRATSDQREHAKMVSYGLMYGMEAYGLSQRLNIEQKEAQAILNSFFLAYPSVKEYMEKSVENARKLGYTETLFGRRRYIPELEHSNYQVRAAAERQAMNAGIQGLAADIFKYALIGIHSEIQKQQKQTQKKVPRLILQVHDEVILEVPTAEKEATADMVRKQMEGAARLDVPLIVGLTFGKTWAAAKK